MATLAPALKQAVETALAAAVQRVEWVGGGDINEARKLYTEAGSYFLKLNRLPQAVHMFETEARGLALLREANQLRVPEVRAADRAGGSAFLLMEYIEPGSPGPRFWEDFGSRLAALHRTPQPYFGLPFDNYIGSLPQPNGRFDTFVELYVERRLHPQLGAARKANLLSAADERLLQQLYRRLPELLPEEAPALLHGDLWNGNFLVTKAGTAALIDPAVAYGHRELDLAMSHLFGGFSPRFYEAYQAHYPTAPGLEDRLELYQLYYLLVHVNLFGSSYTGSVRRILKRYA